MQGMGWNPKCLKNRLLSASLFTDVARKVEKHLRHVNKELRSGGRCGRDEVPRGARKKRQQKVENLSVIIKINLYLYIISIK